MMNTFLLLLMSLCLALCLADDDNTDFYCGLCQIMTARLTVLSRGEIPRREWTRDMYLLCEEGERATPEETEEARGDCRRFVDTQGENIMDMVQIGDDPDRICMEAEICPITLTDFATRDRSKDASRMAGEDTDKAKRQQEIADEREEKRNKRKKKGGRRHEKLKQRHKQKKQEEKARKRQEELEEVRKRQAEAEKDFTPEEIEASKKHRLEQEKQSVKDWNKEETKTTVSTMLQTRFHSDYAEMVNWWCDVNAMTPLCKQWGPYVDNYSVGSDLDLSVFPDEEHEAMIVEWCMIDVNVATGPCKPWGAQYDQVDAQARARESDTMGTVITREKRRGTKKKPKQSKQQEEHVDL